MLIHNPKNGSIIGFHSLGGDTGSEIGALFEIYWR